MERLMAPAPAADPVLPIFLLAYTAVTAGTGWGLRFLNDVALVAMAEQTMGASPALCLSDITEVQTRPQGLHLWAVF